MNEIKVTVTDETSGTSSTRISKSASTPQKAANKLDPKNETAKDNKKSSEALAVASMIASRSFNTVTSNVGKWTGNSRNQDTVNNVRTVVGISSSAFISPVLAVAVAGIQVGSTAIDAVLTNRLEEQRANFRRLRAGYSSDSNTTLGGRK